MEPYKEEEAYQGEAREKWGATEAYREFEQKQKCTQSADKNAQQMMALFGEIGGLRQREPGDQAVQEKISALQAFITEHFYTCTPEILRGLGEMYVGDDRFRQNIDRAGGEGTAEFVRSAIEIFVGKR